MWKNRGPIPGEPWYGYPEGSSEEKLVLKNLSIRDKGKGEYRGGNGILHADIPSDFVVSNNVLSFMLIDMKARCDAIEYEILRRQNLPRKIILRQTVEIFWLQPILLIFYCN